MQVSVKHLAVQQQATLFRVQSGVVDHMRHTLPHVWRSFASAACHLLWNDPKVGVPEQCPHTDSPPDCVRRCLEHQGYSVLVALERCRLVVWPGAMVSQTVGRRRNASPMTIKLAPGSWVVFRDDLLHAGAAYGQGELACRLHFASARKQCSSGGVEAQPSDGFTVWTAAALRRIGVRWSRGVHRCNATDRMVRARTRVCVWLCL